MEYPRVHDLREDNDLRQRQLAQYLYVDQRTYSSYERGKRQIPCELLACLAVLYHTSVDYLMGLTDEPEPYPRAGDRK